MSDTLFNEFNKTSSKEWKQKIQVDLKGADYNDSLIWKTREHIDVKPFYHPDEFTKNKFTSPLKTDHHWKVGQTLEVIDANKGNSDAKYAISKGCEAIRFILNTNINLNELVKDLDHIPISIVSTSATNRDESNITFEYDPIGHLAQTGNWHASKDQDFETLEGQLKKGQKLFCNLSTYQNAGASISQQLAYFLSHTNEYLNLIDRKKMPLSGLHIMLSVGSNYFFEIAKIRAIRILWTSLTELYGLEDNCTISVEPSLRNFSIYDYNVNMLRTTTECMSAILGGADIIYNRNYDDLYHYSNEFGDRIARNQLLILKHESYFDAVENPSDGSYYIESLTQQLCEEAFEIFKSIEASGGFLQQLFDGTIQRKIKESAMAEQDEFNKGSLTLLGVNTFPNEADRMRNNLEKDPFIKVEKRKTLIQPIIQKRLSEDLEKSRLEKE